MEKEGVKQSIKSRVASVRLRAIMLTAGIIMGLILYIFVNLITKQAMSWIDFCLLVVLQYLVYVTYFPEGELFGTRDETYIRNHDAYNEKATKVNEEQKIHKLREFCKVDYQRRLQTYVENECGALGITLKQLEQLKALKEEEFKQIKKEKRYSFKEEVVVDGKKEIKEKLMLISKHKYKRLYNLIFKPLPVQENHAETIMSAVENNGNGKITDYSKDYKGKRLLLKAVQVILTAVILAYIGYQARDGVGLEEIFRMFMYLFTIVANATTAYTTGETCTKVYKNRFYIDLCNFIDEFREWEAKEQPKEQV